MKKSDQIEWLIGWYFIEYGTKRQEACLDANNSELEKEFEKECKADLSRATWQSRVRDAAKELGLKATRHYHNETMLAGVPRFSVVYS